jgi:Cu2+-exporting ATPase
MQKYQVIGMSCAACSARVERAVRPIDGVEDCAVSLLTNTLSVHGQVSPDVVMQAVKQAGYTAILQFSEIDRTQDTTSASHAVNLETRALRGRLLLSLLLLTVLMYLSMGYVMWGAPLPGVLSSRPLWIALLQLALSFAVMAINYRFFLNGVRGVLHGAPNMDTLVSLGAMASFGYSTYLVFVMIGARRMGDHALLHECLHGLYFESAAMILALITLGKMLESRAKGKTTDALRALMDLTPKSATVEREGGLCCIPVSDVRPGDVFVVHPGESIPVDGLVLEGMSAVNEAALT